MQKRKFLMLFMALALCTLIAGSAFATVTAATTIPTKETIKMTNTQVMHGIVDDFAYVTATGAHYTNYTLIWDITNLKYATGSPDISLNFLTFAVTTAGQYFRVIYNANGTQTVTFGALQNGTQVAADYSYTGKVSILSAEFNNGMLDVGINGKSVFAPDVVYCDALQGYQIVSGDLGTVSGSATLQVSFYDSSAINAAVTFAMLGSIVLVGVVFALIKKV